MWSNWFRKGLADRSGCQRLLGPLTLTQNGLSTDTTFWRTIHVQSAKISFYFLLGTTILCHPWLQAQTAASRANTSWIILANLLLSFQMWMNALWCSRIHAVWTLQTTSRFMRNAQTAHHLPITNVIVNLGSNWVLPIWHILPRTQGEKRTTKCRGKHV